MTQLRRRRARSPRSLSDSQSLAPSASFLQQNTKVQRSRKGASGRPGCHRVRLLMGSFAKAVSQLGNVASARLAAPAATTSSRGILQTSRANKTGLSLLLDQTLKSGHDMKTFGLGTAASLSSVERYARFTSAMRQVCPAPVWTEPPTSRLQPYVCQHAACAEAEATALCMEAAALCAPRPAALSNDIQVYGTMERSLDASASPATLPLWQRFGDSLRREPSLALDLADVTSHELPITPATRAYCAAIEAAAAADDADGRCRMI